MGLGDVHAFHGVGSDQCLRHGAACGHDGASEDHNTDGNGFHVVSVAQGLRLARAGFRRAGVVGSAMRSGIRHAVMSPYSIAMARAPGSVRPPGDRPRDGHNDALRYAGRQDERTDSDRSIRQRRCTCPRFSSHSLFPLTRSVMLRPHFHGPLAAAEWDDLVAFHEQDGAGGQRVPALLAVDADGEGLVLAPALRTAALRHA